MEKVCIIQDISKHVRRFNLTGRTVQFKLRSVPEGAEPVSWIRDGIHEIIQKATEGLEPTDQVSFSFCSTSFARGEGWIRFRPVSEVKYEDIWGVISSIYQSNSSGLDTDTFCLGATSVRLPTGRGKRRSTFTYNNFEEECSKRKGIVTINNSDNLCLPRALVVAIANATKDPQYKKIQQDIGKIQLLKAKKLIDDASVIIPEEGAGIPELQKLQEHRKEYQIVVYKYGSKGREIIFKGAVDSKMKLNLLYHEGHYNVITSLTAAFACSYYCEDCHVPYDHKNEHRCGGTCPGCQQSPKCSIDEIKVRCNDCHRYFRGQNCYNNHLAGGSRSSSVCKQIRMCENCFKTVKSDRDHTCGEIFCKICNSHKPEGHYCFIQSDNRRPNTKDFLFVFYDLETRQDKKLENGSYLHETNLCVFKQCCHDCEKSEKEICKICGVRLQILKGADPVASFLIHLLEIRKKFKQVVVIAHNGQAFDHQFILNYLMTNTDLTPELIMRGTKIVLMQLGNVKFLDSLNFFPMPLSALPKAFGLPDKFKKGYFPHLFNREENQEYVGPLPAIEHYSPDSMNEEDRAKFLSWYDVHKQDVFDFKREIVEYCVSDVQILTEACLKFRNQLMSTTNVCPFTEATTIASACNKVFRRNFLKPNTIGIIPKNGYRMKDNQSKIAMKWLLWEEKQRGIDISFAAKEQEAILYGLKVDGYCFQNKEVFEFQGCYYHGCPKCFNYSRNEPLQDDPSETLNLRYESTQLKIDKLKELGYTVTEMWECNFRRELEENPEIQDYVNNHPLLSLTPLKARDAFYGGRTGNCTTHYEVKPNEQIKYVDVCSLYPWVCKYGKFPVGHPEVLVGDRCQEIDLCKIDGLIKCKILPPQKLFHPVLPLKMNNKLMFVLCRTCGEHMNQEECIHVENERVLEGTWVIDEVMKAVDKGYKIVEILEIWKYEVQQFSRSMGTKGLFTDMMNTFIKIKQEASGWPSHCETEELKQQYIDDFFNVEDVRLDFNSIAVNPGLRSQAKLILNSFWGKFGQRENQAKTKIVNNSAEFFAMLTNPNIYVNAALPVSDVTLLVNYEFREEAYEPLSTVNVAVASYVTTQARLKLYSYLEQLGDSVLYYDTDSVIYVSRSREEDIPTGQFIGDMTNELEGFAEDAYIQKFVSGGPKNYAYVVYSPSIKKEKVVCKVKGFSLNYEASKLVNFDSIRDMVLRDLDPIPVVSTNIQRTKDHRVVTVEQTKLYKPNSTKRKFFSDGSSEPYGFKRARQN